MAGVFEVRRYAKFHPGSIFVCTEPTYPNVRDILKVEFDRQFSAAGELGPFARWRASEYKYLLANRAEIWLRACAEYDSLRGPTVAAVWMDEAASSPYEAFRILVPTIRQPGYPFLFMVTTTPKGRNWVFYTFNTGTRPEGAPPYIGDTLPDATVEEFHGTTMQPYLPEITRQAILAAYPPGTRGHEQEVLGQVVGNEGLIYDAFEEAKHVKTMPKETKVARTIGVLDWGWYPDPGVLVVMSLDVDDVIWVRHEVVAYKMPVLGPTGKDDWLGECLRVQKEFGVTEFVADPSEPSYRNALRSGDQRGTGTRRPGVNIKGAKTAVIPGIDMVSARIAADRFRVDPSCTNSLTEVASFCLKQKRGTDDLKQEPQDGNDHSMDCWRYGVIELSRTRARVSEKPKGF